MTWSVKQRTPIRVAFLVQLPYGVSPGQRFRCENWLPVLHDHGIVSDYFPYFDASTYQVLYKPGYVWKKITGTIRGYWKRLALLTRLGSYDFVFIQREAAPIGPPVLEWLISRCLRRRIIFDFDDAIWIPQQANPLVASLKCYWKVKYIIKWSYQIAAGNAFLAGYARQFNTNTLILPTVVDTAHQHNQTKEHSDKSLPVIGWTGSHSTLKYLEMQLGVLEKVYQQIPFQLLVIADRPPAQPFPGMKFIHWSAATEISDLLSMDIGIMPLENDAWSEGKCGFKIIQYLALGIPAVASPVGVNKTIITHNINGFLANSEEEWISALLQLLSSASTRAAFGQQGRKTIEEHYSIAAMENKMLSLLCCSN